MFPFASPRGRSLWFAAMLTVFLGAAWLRSIHAAEILLFGPAFHSAHVAVAQSDGAFYFMVVFQPDAGDMACFEPLVEATSWISAWRNPHGHPRYEFPAIASGEWNAAGGSIGVAHWGVMTLVLGLLALWRNRRSKHREAMHRLLENRP